MSSNWVLITWSRISETNKIFLSDRVNLFTWIESLWIYFVCSVIIRTSTSWNLWKIFLFVLFVANYESILWIYLIEENGIIVTISRFYFHDSWFTELIGILIEVAPTVFFYCLMSVKLLSNSEIDYRILTLG